MGLVYVSAGKPFNFLAKAFWRVLITDGGSGTTGASEVRFNNKGNTKRNGNSLGSGGTHGNAFDDDDETNWSITGEFGEYVGLEFSGKQDIDEVDIVALFGDATNTLFDYDVQFSDDGIEWTTMWSSYGNIPPTGNGQVKTSGRPFVLFNGGAVIHQSVSVIMGVSNDAMINNIKLYSILGVSNDAMINNIHVYAIYDSGS